MIVDWAGAGRGPRLWSLAFLLWAAGMEGMAYVDAVLAAYREHVELEPSELARLPDVLRVRLLVFTVLGFASGSQRPGELRESLQRIPRRSDRIAARVRGL